VRAQSEPSGPEQASFELQVVILELLMTAAKLAVHLAQVSQVDQTPDHVDAFQAKIASKVAKIAKRSWRATLPAGFPFLTIREQSS
jgi:hypothetical protein